MAVSVADIDALFKTLYGKGGAEDATYRNNPGLGVLPKEDGFVGDFWKIPLITGPGGGRSASLATAVANTSHIDASAFYLTRRQDFAYFDLDGDTIEASETNEGAFVNALQETMDAKFNKLGLSIGGKLFRDGTGAIGHVVTVPGGTSFTLAAEEAVFFNVGDVLAATTGTNTNAALRAAGTNTMTITAIDRNTAGVCTVTVGAIVTGLTAADWVVHDGDRPAAAIALHASKRAIDGFDSWLNPACGTLTAADAYYGVVRTADSRLYGNLVAPTVPYTTVEEGLIDAISIACAAGGNVDYAFVNPTQFRRLKKEVSSKTTFVKDVKARVAGGYSATVSYSGITVDGDRGPVIVMMDQACPLGFGYTIDSSSWVVKHLKAMPRILDQDGLKTLRVMTGVTDNYAGMLGYRANVGCKAPSFNARVVLP